MAQFTDEEKKALERYELIVSILKNNNDRRGLVLIQELIEKCVIYFDTLVMISADSKLREILPKRQESEPIPRERLAAMEGMRSSKHNDVISKIEEVNIYLFREYGEPNKDSLIPNGGIYSEDPKHVGDSSYTKYRKDIANWVISLINALYKKGLINL